MLNQRTIKNCRDFPYGPEDHVDDHARRKCLQCLRKLEQARRSMKFERKTCLRNSKSKYISHNCCRSHRNLNFLWFQLQYWAGKTHFSQDYQIMSDAWRSRVGVPLSQWAGDDFPHSEYPPLPVRF